MTEIEELNRFRCRGSDGRSLIVVSYQFFETVTTERGIRKRPGAIRLKLENGEAVRQIYATCFEVIGTGELLTVDPVGGDYDERAEDTSRIPLCRHEELAERENRMRQREKARQ